MKKIFNIFVAGLLGMAAMTAMTSCEGETPASVDEPLAAPSGLAVGTTSQTSAPVSWTAVAGADKYNVSLDDGTPVQVAGTTHEFTGLAPATAYTWRVQAAKGAVTGEWSAGPGFTTAAADIPPPPAPTDLIYSDVTHEGALLTWSHPDADKYEVVVGLQPGVEVPEVTYTASGLDPETEYEWKVRASKNGVWSEWADGFAFTTIATPLPPFDLHLFGWNYHGSWFYGEGTSNFIVQLSTFDPLGSDLNGYVIGLNIVAPTADNSPNKPYLDIAPGTYPFTSEQPTAGHVHLGGDYTPLRPFTNGAGVRPYPKVVEGELIVEGDHKGYTMTVSLKTDTGFTLRGTYNGPVLFENESYNPERVQLYFYDWFYRGAYTFGEGTSNFIVQLSTFDPAGEDQNGWVIAANLITPAVEQPATLQYLTIPNGGYALSKSGTLWTAMVGGEFSVVRQMKDGVFVRPYPGIIGGIVQVFGTPDNYTINTAIHSEGGSVVGSYVGPVLVENPDYLP